MDHSYKEDLERQVTITQKQEQMMLTMYEMLKSIATLTPSRMTEAKTQAFLKANEDLQQLNLRMKSLGKGE